MQSSELCVALVAAVCAAFGRVTSGKTDLACISSGIRAPLKADRLVMSRRRPYGNNVAVLEHDDGFSKLFLAGSRCWTDAHQDDDGGCDECDAAEADAGVGPRIHYVNE